VTATLTIRLPPNRADSSRKPPRRISDIAYKRGFKYLASFLVQLRDAGHHEELNARSYEQLQQGLEVGWDSYSRMMWPYTIYAGQDVLTWWTEMMLHKASFVLAVCYLMLIKSMHLAKACGIVSGYSYFLNHPELNGRGMYSIHSYMDQLCVTKPPDDRDYH
jgi:hypothetical protein